QPGGNRVPKGRAPSAAAHRHPGGAPPTGAGRSCLIMGIRVEPLSAALGACITGIDLRAPIDDAAFAAIHDAWLEHQVLVFPGQELGEEDQLRFTRLFGEMGGRNRKVAAAEEGRVAHPGIMLISNIREDGKPIGSLPDGEMMFHSDGAYAERPFRY